MSWTCKLLQEIVIERDENSPDLSSMVLRTYFWSRPHVAEGGQVRFSVALTNETLGEALECMKSKGLRRHMTLPNSRCGQFLKNTPYHTPPVTLQLKDDPNPQKTIAIALFG